MMTFDPDLKKIHHRLTFLFTGIAGLILVFMSIGYLFLSERELRDNRWLSFLREADTIISNLEEQQIISHDWLTKVTASSSCILALYDNGKPLTYTSTHLDASDQQLAADVLSYALSHRRLNSNTSFPASSVQCSFSYQDETRTVYYVSVAKFQNTASPLYAVILFSTETLKKQLTNQRIRFFLIDFAGILLLFLFSYFYTKKLLSPIVESKQKQNAFLAAASHELRTPIAVILSCISAAKLSNSEKQKEFFFLMEQEGTRMSHLVNDMLTLTRADNHTWSFHMEDTELDTLLLNSYEAFLPQAVEAENRLSVFLPEDVIPACHCDAERISQVLSILLSNALSYGKAGKSIELSLSFRETCFLIVVKDHGIGISDEAKPHIFERFYREDTSRQGKEHFGLGLSIAKEIVEAHHGSITVSDTPGGGTTFTVKLNQSC